MSFQNFKFVKINDIYRIQCIIWLQTNFKHSQIRRNHFNQINWLSIIEKIAQTRPKWDTVGSDKNKQTNNIPRIEL